eukprot:TRINITY_DN6414_c0_g1_i2.p1 TRINITY_DN6414_c0_g1~~TRINITY_DN6414_c0_g1_i2.p1  ORF type:complete len:447 (-),score=130.33 TRINITY_DN6414_c0_g1_i2:36-1346(-)
MKNDRKGRAPSDKRSSVEKLQTLKSKTRKRVVRVRKSNHINAESNGASTSEASESERSDNEHDRTISMPREKVSPLVIEHKKSSLSAVDRLIRHHLSPKPSLTEPNQPVPIPTQEKILSNQHKEVQNTAKETNQGVVQTNPEDNVRRKIDFEAELSQKSLPNVDKRNPNAKESKPKTQRNQIDNLPKNIGRKAPTVRQKDLILGLFKMFQVKKLLRSKYVQNIVKSIGDYEIEISNLERNRDILQREDIVFMGKIQNNLLSKKAEFHDIFFNMNNVRRRDLLASRNSSQPAILLVSPKERTLKPHQPERQVTSPKVEESSTKSKRTPSSEIHSTKRTDDTPLPTLDSTSGDEAPTKRQLVKSQSAASSKNPNAHPFLKRTSKNPERINLDYLKNIVSTTRSEGEISKNKQQNLTKPVEEKEKSKPKKEKESRNLQK